MKKNELAICCLSFLCCILLSACNSEKQEISTVHNNSTDDFITYQGANMVSTPKGYYFLQNGFLYFVSPDFSQSTIVCDKLECIHNHEEVENYMDYYECNAYLDMPEPIINYYDGYLYIASSNPNSHGEAIYKVSLDATEKTLLYECRGTVFGFCIYDGMAYVGNKVYKANSVEHLVTAFPLEHPDEEKVLYQTERDPSRTMNRMKCCYGYCYFYLFDPALAGEDSLYIKIDLKTGKSEEIYEPSTCWIELGKEKTLLQVMDYQSYDPVVWTTEYYSILSENNKMTALTKENFASIGTRDLLRNMDDKYVYFISINYGADTVPQKDQKISVYDYSGKLAAEISAADFGKLYYILPGTEDYMFIQVDPVDDYRLPYEFYYVDKSEFNGGTVEAHRIDISR